MEPLEMYRVCAIGEYGRIVKRWYYDSKKALHDKKDEHVLGTGIYVIVCEKFNFDTEKWQPYFDETDSNV